MLANHRIYSCHKQHLVLVCVCVFAKGYKSFEGL